MRIEAVLNSKDLIDYKEVLRTSFSYYSIQPAIKHLNLIYDYIRFYKDDLLNNPKESFDFIFNDKELLSRYGMKSLNALIRPLKFQDKLGKISIDEFSLTFGQKGKAIYFKIKLLEIESAVLKYKLDFMNKTISY